MRKIGGYISKCLMHACPDVFSLLQMKAGHVPCAEAHSQKGEMRAGSVASLANPLPPAAHADFK